VLSNDSLKGIAPRAASIISIAVAGFGLAGFAHAAGLDRVDVGAQAPQFAARGADGKQHSLRDYAGKLVVLEWTNPVCPFTAVKKGKKEKIKKRERGEYTQNQRSKK